MLPKAAILRLPHAIKAIGELATAQQLDLIPDLNMSGMTVEEWVELDIQISHEAKI